MTVELTVVLDSSDADTLSLVAGAAGRSLSAYVADLAHAEARRLRQAEAFQRLADQRITVQDTWFPGLVTEEGTSGDAGPDPDE